MSYGSYSGGYAGNDVELEGTPAGIATVAGSLTVTETRLVGASDGVSIVGNAVIPSELSGVSGGSSAVEDVLGANELSGVAVGMSTADSTLISNSDFVELAGTTTSASVTVGWLVDDLNSRGLEALDAWYQSSGVWASYQSTGTDIAFLMTICYLPGGPRGLTRIDGELDPIFAGSSAGSATVIGAIQGPPAVLLEGTSTVTGYLAVELVGAADGTSTVTGTLNLTRQLSGQSDGTSTMTAEISLKNLAVTIDGTSLVTAFLTRSGVGLEPGYEIPYPFLGDGSAYNEASAGPGGSSTVTGALAIEHALSGLSDGDSTMTGTLYTEAGPAWMSGLSDGFATVTGFLQVGQVDDDGDFIVELAGQSDGTSTAIGYLGLWLPSDPIAQGRYLYLLCHIGVSFDPTDDDSGDSRYVSQTFEDGDVWQFNRYLHLLGNVGVSFDPTDDDSADPRFVSQTFEDGHTRDDFFRYLHLLANLIEAEPVAYGQVTVNEGYSGTDRALPRRTPPSRGF